MIERKMEREKPNVNSEEGIATRKGWFLLSILKQS